MTPFWYKKIGKMIEGEDNPEVFYELNHRYVPTLLSLGFIEERRWTTSIIGRIGVFSCSAYFVTEKGREAHKNYKVD